MLSKSNTFIGISIFSPHDQHFICYFLYRLFKKHTFKTMSDVIYVLVQIRFFRELRLETFSWMTYGHVEECIHLSLKLNFNSEIQFFFVLRLVTVFNFALICWLQNRPWKPKFTFFSSIQNTWLKYIHS